MKCQKRHKNSIKCPLARQKQYSICTVKRSFSSFPFKFSKSLVYKNAHFQDRKYIEFWSVNYLGSSVSYHSLPKIIEKSHKTVYLWIVVLCISK